MRIIDFLEMLFPRHNDANSRQKAKERLQVVLAHDRATVTPDVIDSMRKEILEVVARYVEVDKEEMEFGLENSQRITSLIANFPIRQVKRNPLKKVDSAPKNNDEPAETTEKFNDELLEL
jgi:cell division topological specificity factor